MHDSRRGIKTKPDLARRGRGLVYWACLPLAGVGKEGDSEHRRDRA